MLASASADSTIKLWDPATGNLRSTLKSHLDEVEAVVFSSDGQLLASGSDDDTVRIWNPVTEHLRDKLTRHVDGDNAVVFSPDGQLLASGSDDYTVRLWLVKSKTFLQQIEHTHWGDMHFGGDGMSQLIMYALASIFGRITTLSFCSTVSPF